MKRLAFLLGAFLLAACATTPAPPPAPDITAAAACTVPDALRLAGETRDTALAAMTPDEQAALLLTLPDCLENPDPQVRDGYAYETLSTLLRKGEQETETVRTLMAALLARLASADDDAQGFRGPFAALALAEVARVDRITPFLSEEERWDLLMAATHYLEGLTDYRGYSDTEGWRHGVAHTADLLMQMSLNAHLTKPQAEAILAAVATKVGTPDHSYIFGETERLAAPVIYIAHKEFFTPEDWVAWFGALWPQDDPLRDVAYSSEAALAKLHNLRAFSEAVYVTAASYKQDAFIPVLGGAFNMLNTLP